LSLHWSQVGTWTGGPVSWGEAMGAAMGLASGLVIGVAVVRAARARMRGWVKCIVGEVGGGWCGVEEIGLRVDEERDFLGVVDWGVIYIGLRGSG